MADLNTLTATEAAALIAQRKVSSEELTKACLARIRTREPRHSRVMALSPASGPAVERATPSSAATEGSTKM